MPAGGFAGSADGGFAFVETGAFVGSGRIAMRPYGFDQPLVRGGTVGAAAAGGGGGEDTEARDFGREDGVMGSGIGNGRDRPDGTAVASCRLFPPMTDINNV